MGVGGLGSHSFTPGLQTVQDAKGTIDSTRYGLSNVTAGTSDSLLRNTKLYSAVKASKKLNFISAGKNAAEAVRDFKAGNYVGAAENAFDAGFSAASGSGAIDRVAKKTAEHLGKTKVGAGGTALVVGSAINVVGAAKDGIAEYAKTGDVSKALMKYADSAGGTTFNEGLDGLVSGRGSTMDNVQKMGEGAAKLIGADYLIPAGKWLGESAAKLAIKMGW